MLALQLNLNLNGERKCFVNVIFPSYSSRRVKTS